MRRRHIVFIWFFLAYMAASPYVRAATLDDDSIHTFFNGYAAVMKANDIDAIIRFLQKSIDDKFLMQTSSVVTINGGMPRSSSNILDKQHLITATLGAHERGTVDIYDIKVLNIKYSDDHKSAFVEAGVAMTMTGKGPQGNGNSAAGHMQEEDKCTAKLILADEEIRMVYASCNGIITAETQPAMPVPGDKAAIH